MGRPKHSGKWSCQKCSKEFSHKQSLNNHKRSCGLESTLKCNTCSKSFSRQWYLKKHVCKVKQSTTCMECGKVFTTVWHLNRHIKQMHSKSKAGSIEKSRKSIKIGVKRTLENDFNYFEEADCDDSFVPSMIDFSSISEPSQSIISDESFVTMRSSPITPRFMRKVCLFVFIPQNILEVECVSFYKG